LACSKDVTQCVNGGDIGAKVTGGQSTINQREENLQKIRQGLRQCQSISSL
jgi:hypothetical protein